MLCFSVSVNRLIPSQPSKSHRWPRIVALLTRRLNTVLSLYSSSRTSSKASIMAHLVRRLNENGDCTQDTCPVSQSVYGYRPDLVATWFFLILFALSGCIYTWQAFKTRTWFFSTVMILGSVSEVLGYVAKMLLWSDPFSDTGFKMSVVLLTFAPAFVSFASTRPVSQAQNSSSSNNLVRCGHLLYTQAHLVGFDPFSFSVFSDKPISLTFGASFSRLTPNLYTYIFISCDVLSILFQAAGGAIASAASGTSLLHVGNHVMMTGLSTQVFTLVGFGILAFDYGLSAYRNRDHLNPATADLRRSRMFRMFLVALWVAYFGILIRCCYRVAELADGWSHENHILRTQGLFIGLDSIPIGIAAVALNIWHPGRCFPKDRQDTAHEEEKWANGTSSNGGIIV